MSSQSDHPDHPDHRRWQDHLQQVVLPWWEQAVRPGGGVYTCYSNDGRRTSNELYTWSQGRWAWLAAELADEARAGRLDLDPEMWDERATSTAALLVERAVLDDATTSFRLSDAGDPLASGPDGELSTSVFADLFVVLGIAGALRILGDDDHRRESWHRQALRVLLAADSAIAARTAPSQPYPVPPGYADLAGPMTLVHVASEMLRARDDDAVRGVRDRARGRLLGSGGFLELDQQRWWEFQPLTDDAADTMLASHRTPGHLLELVWMLLHSADQQAERLDTTSDLDPAPLVGLALKACELGWDEQFGGILRYVDSHGGEPEGRTIAEAASPYETLVGSTWDTKLWWVHAEAMYAAHLLARRTGDPRLARWATTIEDYTMATFPDPQGREWLQIRRRDGSPLDEVVALPVKDPFHIIRTLLLLNRLHATTEPARSPHP